jgi:hypothetical protein
MKKTMSEVSQSSDDRPEPHWLGTLLAMLGFLALMMTAFLRDAALKKQSENDWNSAPVVVPELIWFQ